ncbi:MAG: caspase family protein [Acidimicrobiales bacterium]
MKRRIVPLLVLAALMAAAPGPIFAAPANGDDRWALVIGISKHAGRTKGTVGGAGDAEAVREALRRAGFADNQTMVLVDGAATAANIRRGLAWLRTNSSDRTFSMFHYSGHVLQKGGDRDRDGEALDEYLMPHDSRNLISDRELSEQLRAVRGWLWADIAGCESAGFDEGGLSSPRRLVTASSQEHEKSYERPDWRRSVFTGLLVDQGLLGGQGDSDRSGMVSIQEAFRHAARLAPEITARQRLGPQHPYIAGGDGAEWFLRPPAPPPPPPPRQPGPGPGRLCVVVCVG